MKLVEAKVPVDVVVVSTGVSSETVGPEVDVNPRICTSVTGSKFVAVTAVTVPGTPEVGERVTVRVPNT